VVRAQRAQLKRDLKEGPCAIDVVLADPPTFVQTAKVADLLLAVPKYGPVKVNKLLSRCRIAPTKTIGGLTQRQRDELAILLGAVRQNTPQCSRASAQRPRSVQEPVVGLINPLVDNGGTTVPAASDAAVYP
jgi:S13-like protein